MTDSTKKPVNVVAILGSVRPGNNTAKVLSVVRSYISDQQGITLEIVDPAELTLHLPGRGISNDAKEVQARIKKADAVILATPEYHGSYSSVTKLIIDNLGFPSALKGKPVSLLGVASGRIGAIKALEHLRSVASHVGAIVLPGPVSIANVKSVFDQSGNLIDTDLLSKIERFVDDLVAYARVRICPDKTLEGFVRQN